MKKCCIRIIEANNHRREFNVREAMVEVCGYGFTDCGPCYDEVTKRAVERSRSNILNVKLGR